MNFRSIIQKDPFRLFFPLGAGLALLGVAPWTLQLFENASYPRELHRIFMINGFLLAFVCGFLMTAIPRFTSSFPAERLELLGVFTGLVSSALAVFLLPAWTPYLFSALVVLILIEFAGRRFVRRTSNPPYTFVFIGLGMAFWLIANIVQSFNLMGIKIPPEIIGITNDLFTNGAIMSLILGVGGRLIPGILGWQEIVSHQRGQYEKSEPFISVVPLEIWAAMGLFVASFFLAPVLPMALCFFIRGAVTAFIAVKYWRVYRFPKTRSYLTWSIWGSCWCLTIGYFLPALWPSGAAHAMHLLFIAGFSLLTLLISTRVSFAHSSKATDAETRARGILIFTGVLLLAMVTRVTAILWPNIYFHHLGYAAILWILGLAIWAYTLRDAL
jgi:uncharacterized protein involved in response to NO